MIDIGIAAVALLAFIRQRWLLGKYKQYKSRQGLSGCEIARQLLDRIGFPQVSVQAVSGWDRFRMGTDNQLLLEEAVYRGKSLYGLAEAARQAVLLSKSPGAVISMNWLVRVRLVLRILVIPAWILFLAGFMSFKMAGLKWIGLFILQTTFLLGIFELSREWEASQEAFELLKKAEAFEADEIVKLRGLLSALKLKGLAEIFNTPYEIITGFFGKRKPHGV